MHQQKKCMICPGCNLEMDINERFPVFLQCGHVFCNCCLESQKSQCDAVQDFLNVQCYVCFKKQDINLTQLQNIKNNCHFFAIGYANQNQKKHQHFCKLHTDKRIKFYCDSEKIFYCSKCQPKHYNHIHLTKEFNPQDLENAIKDIITDLKNFNNEKCEQIQQLNEAEENEKINFEQNKKELIAKIESERENLKIFVQNQTNKEISKKQNKTLEKIRKLQEESEKKIMQLEQKCLNDIIKQNHLLDLKIKKIEESQNSLKINEIQAQIKEKNRLKDLIHQQIQKLNQNLNNFTNQKLYDLIELFQSANKFQIDQKVLNQPKIYFDFDQFLIHEEQQIQENQFYQQKNHRFAQRNQIENNLYPHQVYQGGFEIDESEWISAKQFTRKRKSKTEQKFPYLIRAGHNQSESEEKKKEEEIQHKKVEIEEIVDDPSPFKGKSSSFFRMKKNKRPPTDIENPSNFQLNHKQWEFIFLYYTEYADCPYGIMLWLSAQAKRQENAYKQRKQDIQKLKDSVEQTEQLLQQICKNFTKSQKKEKLLYKY